MDHELINIQNRLTNLELEIMSLKQEIKELRMDMIQYVHTKKIDVLRICKDSSNDDMAQ